jgi:hypothetical protein
MTVQMLLRVQVMLLSLAALGGSLAANAVELQDLKGLEAIYGRYAPGGDCKKQPQVLVDATGITFFAAGAQEKVTNPEQALEYNGPDYQGPDVWIFPFRIKDGYSVLMTFNYNSKIGVLTIDPHGEGYPGGPKLSARNQALVSGSPYKRCK